MKLLYHKFRSVHYFWVVARQKTKGSSAAAPLVQGFKRGCAAGSRVQARLRRWFKGSSAAAPLVHGFNRACGAGSIGLTASFKGSGEVR